MTRGLAGDILARVAELDLLRAEETGAEAPEGTPPGEGGGGAGQDQGEGGGGPPAAAGEPRGPYAEVPMQGLRTPEAAQDGPVLSPLFSM